MLRYDIRTGVKSIKTKTAIVASATVLGISGLGMAVVIPAVSNAAGNGDGSNASACGAAHGAFADANGNYGFLGPLGGTPGYHNGAVGQDPGATGSNNSSSTCHQ
jgi:hypothetical protein